MTKVLYAAGFVLFAHAAWATHRSPVLEDGFPQALYNEVALVCCKVRTSVDNGRRIGVIYVRRNDYCLRNDEGTVEMKFCNGVPR